MFILGSIYTLLTHFPITIINTIIMIKEAMLYVWPLLTQSLIHSEQPITSKLTLFDMGDAFYLFGNLNNPAYWFRLGFKLIFNWDPVDTIIENKDDEEHYYAGQFYDVIKSKF